MIDLASKEDYLDIEWLIRESFWNVNGPGCDEHYMIHHIRKMSCYNPSLDLTLKMDDKVVGVLTFLTASIKTKEDMVDILTICPLAIHPFYQKQGLGSRLMETGLNRAKALGYKGVVIWGDPQYYEKFGFVKGQDVGISTSDGTFNDAVLCKALEEGFFNVVKGRFIELHDLNIVKEDVIRYDQDFLKKRSMTSQTQG